MTDAVYVKIAKGKCRLKEIMEIQMYFEIPANQNQ